ncbi:TRAP transporter large permease [Halomonas sp. V046]|uniref:TRAP transporter large permease n=1 Tax=Halomonas sp. V046 TaxID=3459611 RepID=UPI004044051C
MTLLLVSLFAMLLIGVPIAYSLGISGILYFVFLEPDLIGVLPQRMLAGMDLYTMIALPLFILMGLVMNASGITSRLIDFCLMLVGRFRGGLGHVNISTSMIFGGISGSSVADTASVGASMIPEMARKGYTVETASGITVASSTMGMIIPPSIPMVIYAVTAQQSIGTMFLASLVPGVMIGLFMMGVIVIMSGRNGYPRASGNLSRKEKVSVIQRALLAFLIPVFVVGSVVGGIATATESAAIGAFYAITLGVVVFRTLPLSALPALFRSAIITSATVMIIIAMSQLYVWILTIEQVPLLLGNFLTSLELSPFALLLVVVLAVLFIGTFIDVTPAILLVTPVVLPILTQAGISPIHFGVLLVSTLAIGLVTPPVGMCLNVCSSITGLSIGRIFRGALPFLLANLLVILVVMLFPALTLWPTWLTP